MGRLLVISAVIHVALLIVLPLVPGLTREYEPVLDVYAVELMDMTPEVQPPPVEESETEIEEPPAEEPRTPGWDPTAPSSGSRR